MRKIVLVVVGVVVALAAVAVGGYFFVEQRIKGQIEDGLRALAANPPSPYRSFSYGPVEFSLRQKRAVFSGLKAEGEAGNSISVATAELYDFDADAWEKTITGSADTSFRKIFSKAVLVDLVAASGGAPVRADKATITELELKPLPASTLVQLRQLPPAEAVRTMLAYIRMESVVLEGVKGVSGGRDMTFARSEAIGLRDERFKSFVFEKLEHDQIDGKLSIGRMELQGGLTAIWFSPPQTKTLAEKLAYLDFASLKFADLRKADAASPQNAVTVAAIEMGPVDSKKLASFVVRDLAVVEKTGPEPVDVKIAAMEVRDFDWEQVLPVFAGLIDDAQGPGAASDALRAQLEKIGMLRYSVGRMSVSGMSVAPGIGIGEIVVTGRNDSGTGEGDLAINNFTVKAAELQSQNAGAGLTAFGYANLNLSLRMRAVSNATAGTAALESMEVSGPQVGKLTLSYAVSNYRPPTSASPDPLAQFLAASIDRIELGWQDDGLSQRALAAAARQQRISVVQLKAGLAMQLRELAAPYARSPRVAELSEALRRYLDKPGSLAISARPKQPVPVMNVLAVMEEQPGQPPDLPALFDLLEVKSEAR